MVGVMLEAPLPSRSRKRGQWCSALEQALALLPGGAGETSGALPCLPGFVAHAFRRSQALSLLHAGRCLALPDVR